MAGNFESEFLKGKVFYTTFGWLVKHRSTWGVIYSQEVCQWLLVLSHCCFQWLLSRRPLHHCLGNVPGAAQTFVNAFIH